MRAGRRGALGGPSALAHIGQAYDFRSLAGTAGFAPDAGASGSQTPIGIGRAGTGGVSSRRGPVRRGPAAPCGVVRERAARHRVLGVGSMGLERFLGSFGVPRAGETFERFDRGHVEGALFGPSHGEVAGLLQLGDKKSGRALRAVRAAAGSPGASSVGDGGRAGPLGCASRGFRIPTMRKRRLPHPGPVCGRYGRFCPDCPCPLPSVARFGRTTRPRIAHALSGPR